MRVYKISVLLFFHFSCSDIGAGYEWNENALLNFYRNFGTQGYDYGWSASNSPYDDGIVIAGTQEPNIGGQRDLWAIKTDNRGIATWEKKFGGSQNEEGYDVISTTDGGYLFVGYSWSFGNNQQIYIVKTDFHGNKEWDNTYGGSMWEVGYSVIELIGGGYAISGFSNSPGISSGNTDMLLLKIDNFGNQTMLKTYGNLEYPNHEWAYDLIEDLDKNILLVGAIDRYSKGSKNSLIIKVDKDGNKIWRKEIITDGQESETAYSIAHSLNGGYYVCSGTNSSSNLNFYKPKIMKIDSSGNVDWERIINTNSLEYHQFRISSTQNGSIILAGTSIDNNTISNKSDAFIYKFDSKGNIIWTKPYGTFDEDDWGWYAFEKPNGDIIMIGSTKSFNSSLFDVFLVGVNSKGN